MSFNNGPTVVTNGLVLALDAGDRNSYVSGSTTWFDLTGANNGTLVNGPTFNTGSGGSIVFDGTNDFVNLGDKLGNLTNITYEVWFNTTAYSIYDSLIEKDRSAWVSAAIHIISGSLAWIVGNIVSFPYSTDITSSLTYNDGNWHQVVGTYNQNTSNLYVDGILQATTGSTNPIIYSTGRNFQIGYHFESFSYFDGKIAKASVYNRALSAQEVLQNYNATKGRFGL